MYISNDFFIVPDLINQNIWQVYKVCDGILICQFENNDDFEFIHNHMCKKRWTEPEVTGILDKRTNRIYDVNLTTLMYFGAQKIVVDTNDLTFRKEDQLRNERRIQILNLIAPVAFFVELDERAKWTKREKLGGASSFILRSTLLK